jgi:hypothetical protein
MVEESNHTDFQAPADRTGVVDVKGDPGVFGPSALGALHRRDSKAAAAGACGA